jgi:hypothetical protein
VRKKKIIFIFATSVILIFILAVGLFSGIFESKGAHLVIESNPPSIVSINSQQTGRTPFKKDLPGGEIDVKLVPQSEQPLVAYETKVNLVRGIETVIHRDFGATEEDSAGELVSFEKIGERDGVVSVISTPEGVQVKIDGQVRGTTPLKVSPILSGVHQLSVNGQGLKGRSFLIQVIPGYRLIADVTLAKSNDTDQLLGIQTVLPQDTPFPGSTPVPISSVQILSTPTGFLRVRSAPSVSSSEVGRATPGKSYKFLQKDEKSGWFKIQLNEDITGWVSNEYASPSAKLTP